MDGHQEALIELKSILGSRAHDYARADRILETGGRTAGDVSDELTASSASYDSYASYNCRCTEKDGGLARNRTGVNGFAIRRVTTPPRGPMREIPLKGTALIITAKCRMQRHSSLTVSTYTSWELLKDECAGIATSACGTW